jgi:1,4-alpha-glucan branching enzyme
VELWTSAATHALLPLLATDGGRALQLHTGIASHENRFGGWGGGFWLPECGYEPGLERDLAEYGTRCFCVDQTKSLGDHLRPIATEAGPVAVPVDWQTVELIWGPRGYPSHGSYRDYHGRTEHDLRPWNNAGEPYDHEAALALAREHAREFVAHVGQRLDGGGLLCCALDTELIGHWWYEGPEFLRAVLAEAPAAGIDLVTLPDGLAGVEPVEGPLAPSTWGRDKDFSTWDSPHVARLVFEARRAELRTLAAASSGLGGTALERATRELLAIQSSDWTFMTTHEMAGDYPRERVDGHLASLDSALAGSGGAALRNLAPRLDLSPLVAP